MGDLWAPRGPAPVAPIMMDDSDIDGPEIEVDDDPPSPTLAQQVRWQFAAEMAARASYFVPVQRHNIDT